MKQFNNLTLEEQLGLRFYNLEVTYGRELVFKRLRYALNTPNHDELYLNEFWMVNRGCESDMWYVNVNQVVKYFGKELTLRFLSFNFKEEMEKAG